MIIVRLVSILIDFSLREWASLVLAFILRSFSHTHHYGQAHVCEKPRDV